MHVAGINFFLCVYLYIIKWHLVIVVCVPGVKVGICLIRQIRINGNQIPLINFLPRLEPIQTVIGREVGYTLHKLPVCCRANTQRDKQPVALTFTPVGYLEWPLNYLDVFGLWEKVRVPRENPHRHGKRGHTERPDGISNSEPSSCEATVPPHHYAMWNQNDQIL